MKNIVIVEDHPIVMFNLQAVFRSHAEYTVLQTFYSGQSFLTFPQMSLVDLVLLDINLPDISGLELCRMIHEQYPHVLILGISSFEEGAIISKFLNCGARGYVVKGSDNKVLIAAVEALLAGKHYLCDVSRQAYESFEQSATKAVVFTKREQRVLALDDQPLTVALVAQELQISAAEAAVFYGMLQEKIKTFKLDGSSYKEQV